MNPLAETAHRCTRAACTSFFVLLAWAGLAGAHQVIDLHSVARVARDPVLTQRAGQLSALARADARDEIGRELRRIAQDGSLSPLAREWLLDHGLNEAAQLAPTAELRAAVEGIAGLRAEVLVRSDPEQSARAVPLYDPGATAQFVLRGWTRTDARARSLAALRSGASAPISRFLRDDTPAELDPAKSGIVDAFRTLEVEALARHRGAILAAIESGQRVDELAAVMAERLTDAELHALVIDQADPDVALGAVQRSRAVFGDAVALDLLSAASRRAELASAALLEIGQLARHDTRGRAQLLSSMDDPSLASSAAAALASLHDSALADELGRRLRTEERETSRRHLVLALQLDGSAAARVELERFAATRKGSAALQKEVRAWLAR